MNPDRTPAGPRAASRRPSLQVPATPAAACRSCLEHGPDHVLLVHDRTGERMAICPRCLRSQLRMKADIGDQRGRRLLQGYAEEYEWHVWRSPNVLYLIPSMLPSTPREAPMPRAGKPRGLRA